MKLHRYLEPQSAVVGLVGPLGIDHDQVEVWWRLQKEHQPDLVGYFPTVWSALEAAAGEDPARCYLRTGPGVRLLNLETGSWQGRLPPSVPVAVACRLLGGGDN